MTTDAPRLMARNGGVLKIPASVTHARQNMASAGAPSGPRLKLVIRRLPPALTEEEFEAAMGDGWRVGSGRVDWAVYKSGKASKDPTKPSRPSRAYLNLTKQEYISVLSDHVRNTKFIDAKNTSKDSVLRGPPSVEFAPYGRTPRARVRKDARQGTIDQDPEFIEFLESLTNPVPKPASVDQQAAMASQSKEKVTTTPLIQYLKEKKANKGKDGAATIAKGTKHTKQTSKDTPSSSVPASDKTSPAKTAPPTGQMPDKRSPQAIMVEKAARDAARIGNKQASTANKPQSPSPAPASPVTAPTSTGSSPLAEKKRERGSASAAASILRRDLGIGASPGARGGRRGLSMGQGRPNTNTSAQGAPAVPVQVENAKPTSNPAPTASSPPTNTVNRTVTAASTTNSSPAPPAPGPQPPTGPAASRMPPKAPASNAAPTPPKPSPTSSTATQAFLKHANPSQGITEPLLEDAFAAFGTVKRVEIDRKKGSAYVDFEDPEGLQNAIKASPVKVAQGQVVVLERRIGPNPQARNVRGGPMMNNPRAINARGGMVNQRGGMVNNRGGGIPIGPMGARGGAVRGRGGFVRGRGNMPNAVNNRPAASTTHQSAQENTSSTTVTTARNGSTPPPSEPPKEAANPSASTPPAADESAT